MEAHNVQWPGKKAQQIIATAHKVCNEFSGHVPDTRDALETLPGIGHHAASVTLALMFNQNAFGVDTHVSRIMQRLGFADSEDSNLAIEKYVMSHIPAHMLGDFSRSFVDFGKTICSFQPKCAKCFLKECCVFAAVQPATKIKDVRSNQLKDGTYQVPSSAPGKFYTITVTDGHAQCTCTGFRFRQTCKHIEGAHKWSK